MLDVKFLGANGSIQEEQSLNTSLLFSDCSASVLVDASANIYIAVEADVDTVFITHNHTDHMYALPSLLHQLWLCGRQKKLDVICPATVVTTIENLIGVFSLRSKKNMFEINIIPASSHKYGSMTFDTFKTDHTEDSIGLVVKDAESKIVYTADSRPILKGQPSWTKADILIHEASGLSADEEILIKKGHSSAKDAAILAKDITAKKLILCHLPVGNEAKQKILQEARTIFSETYLPATNVPALN